MRDESHLDFAFDDGVAALDGRARRPRARWLSAFGAIASVTALALVVVWSYRLGVRDAADVPVIRAVAGPAKVRPDDPGGMQVAHQGRAVYDALAEEPGAPPTQIALAPPAETLTEADLPAPPARPEPRAAAGSETVETAPAAAPPVDPLAGSEPEAESVGPEAPEAADAAPVEVSTVDPTPRAPSFAPPAPPRLAARAATVRPVPATAAAETPRAEPAVERRAPERESAPISVSAPRGPQIQLGAYLTAGDAARMWTAIRSRNGDLLAGRERVVAAFEQEDRTLYLLRAAPFSDMAEARLLCTALKARGEDCLVAGGG